MGLYDYMILSEEEQWNELWDKGEFISHYDADGRKLTLYALHRFFVEVDLSPDTGKIIGKKHFVCGKELVKYSGKNIGL